MGLMGFAAGTSKGTDKGRLRKPNPQVNHLIVQYFNVLGVFGPQSSNLKYFFFPLKRLFNAPEFGKFGSSPLSAFSSGFFSPHLFFVQAYLLQLLPGLVIAS